MSVNFSPFGRAVWPAIGNIYIYECLVLLYGYVFLEEMILVETLVLCYFHFRNE